MMNNYFGGGTGGVGGPGYGNGVGGSGGDGMGASLNCAFHGDVVMNNAYQRGETGIDILHRSVALAAIYDSMESFPQPKCHPETRTRIRKGLRKWVLGDMDAQFETSFHWLFGRREPEPRCSIVWLYGPAGAGKSAVMQTLCGDLDAAGRLGGSFFFKRSHATHGNAKTLFATIAYQLALHVPWLRTPISEIVEHDPSIAVRTLTVQMRKLIFEPCRGNENGETVTILIDGLDECDGMDVQVEILRIIRHSSSQGPTPLRFIIASRPEAHIREMFDSPIYVGHHRSVNLVQSFDDVRKYLRDEFSRIHREHRTMANISLPWPSWDILEQLVDNSSGHFIYASTIIKFIDDKSYRPTERLAMVQDTNSAGAESAFGALDQLYITILSSAPRQSQLIQVLCTIVHLRLKVCDIDQLFGLAEGETRLILRGLHSVLDIPQDDEHQILSHHASFLDFLKNPDRSGDFCVSQIDAARILLHYYGGPLQRRRLCLLSSMINLIVSLPPRDEVAELFPLIGSINPDWIFDPVRNVLRYDDVKSIISWLQNSPSVPTNVIQLWEDYAFMLSIDNMHRYGNIAPFVKHIVSPSPELLRILLSMGFISWGIWELPTILDLTWTDLRTTLCSLRSQLVGDDHALPIHQPQVDYPWVARDLALHLIRMMVKNHIDTDGGVDPSASRGAVLLYNTYSTVGNLEEAYIISQNGLGCDISLLVRLSPPCSVLYRELWSIPTSDVWSSLPSGNVLIHHVSKWLESFPDSTNELITSWQQAAAQDGHYRITRDLDQDVENYWRYRVETYNDKIVGLHLPDSLKILNRTNHYKYEVPLA
ncbi:NACHT domain-containing protein [Mycena sanguinolenta]|uniref:NACHT domain-containing protein n=1 Tax=Mycena sanguinolenta TaxID=230812 RepID=A0A8H6Z8E9_9AGAR|nr:NACHT domain-containing protein [Mycena sanguinolenta]